MDMLSVYNILLTQKEDARVGSSEVTGPGTSMFPQKQRERIKEKSEIDLVPVQKLQ
jgi:hypothetical protein